MRLLLLVLLAPSLAFAQGQLSPPDGSTDESGPKPTMKTLDQVEPRRPVCATSHGVTQNPNGGFTISASGSYYLEDNLSVGTGDGIVIKVSNVSLDLSGFTIFSFASPAAGKGINVDGDYSNIAIRNGHIRGMTTYNGTTQSFTPGGFSWGIFAPWSNISGLSATRVSVVAIAGNGISLSIHSSTISGCTASTCAGGGFSANTVSDSSADTCGGYVIDAFTVANCQASGVTTQTGYSTISAKAVTNSVGSGITGNGIRATTVTNCLGSSTTGYGIYAENTATGSSGTSTQGTGLLANIATNCTGTSTTGIGLEATRSATGCSGVTGTGSYGLRVAASGSSTADGTAENCRGEIFHTTDASSVGLFAGTATNCIGINKTGTGLSAEVATGCKGSSTAGIGLLAKQNASGCTGTTVTGPNGLTTEFCGTAENCRGTVTGAGATGIGLAAETATNCFGGGTAGIGLSASTATNCSALSSSGSPSMSIAGTANGCRGNSGKAGGNAIEAAIAIGCTTYSGAIVAPQKFLGTP